jgi:hypothetical protein
LTELSGLFHFAEGSDEGAYTIWIDDLSYVTLGEETLGDIIGEFGTTTPSLEVGQTATAGGLMITAIVDGAEIQAFPAGAHFAWSSSDDEIASVDATGVVTGVAEGVASITATVGGNSAGGLMTVSVVDGLEVTPAPEPVTPEGAVIASLFSDSYAATTVTTFRTDWSVADYSVVDLGESNEAILYSSLDFVGIETTGENSLDISGATHVHFDFWTSDAEVLRIKLADWGTDNAFGGEGDAADTDSEIVLDPGSTPAVTTGVWVQVDLPLSDFGGLAAREHISQYIFSAVPAGGANVYIDNFYFYSAP